MRQWDIIIIGGGVIGLALAWELHKRRARVLVIDKNEPGREASWAAGGMLAYCDPHLPEPLRDLALESGRLWPELVGELEDASGIPVDFRTQGSILFDQDPPGALQAGCRRLTAAELSNLEPALRCASENIQYWPEESVDPRGLMGALVKAAKHRGIDIASGDAVVAVETENGRVTGVRTHRSRYSAPVVVNCAGAWAGQIDDGLGHASIPARPVKGQMLAVIPPRRDLLQHVVRSEQVYLIPRSDGRIVIGATVEEKGFDKRTDPATIQSQYRAAIDLLPELAHGKIHEDWAGLRPGTPDGLPILGATSLPGYSVATGHYRDGILLAPATAAVMSQLINGETPHCDLSAFEISRFGPLNRDSRGGRGDQIREERRLLRAKYGQMFDATAAVLFRHDPIHINFVTNPDEYQPEAGTILPRLKTCVSIEDVRRVVHEEFVRWFDGRTAGPEDCYSQIAVEIWELWRSSGFTAAKRREE